VTPATPGTTPLIEYSDGESGLSELAQPKMAKQALAIANLILNREEGRGRRAEGIANRIWLSPLRELDCEHSRKCVYLSSIQPRR
jgi:hypothetical protein